MGNTASPAGGAVRSLLGCSSVRAEPETETLASVFVHWRARAAEANAISLAQKKMQA